LAAIRDKPVVYKRLMNKMPERFVRLKKTRAYKHIKSLLYKYMASFVKNFLYESPFGIKSQYVYKHITILTARGCVHFCPAKQLFMRLVALGD
jgi:hypothetical protein